MRHVFKVPSSVHALAILLQETTIGETTGVVEQAGQAAGELNQETTNSLRKVQLFFEGVGNYITSPEFVAKIIASMIVAALGIIFYRLLTHGVPRVLRWRRR